MHIRTYVRTVRISVDRTIFVPVLAMGSAGEWRVV